MTKQKIVIGTNFCMSCIHLHITPYWYIVYDDNLIAWRHWLCEPCAEKKITEKLTEHIGCRNCGNKIKFEELFEHKCKSKEAINK